MFDHNGFVVNMRARYNSREWTTHFALQEQAEEYIRFAENDMAANYEVLSHNFERRFSNDQLDAFLKLQAKVVKEATRLEKWAAKRSNLSYSNPALYPCEVCGGAHANYNCCEKCNFGNHRCHFCGDALGHKEFSVCYITWAWEENYGLAQTQEEEQASGNAGLIPGIPNVLDVMPHRSNPDE